MQVINNKKFSQSFSEEQKEYGYYFDERQKKRVFGVVGKKNIYQDIQSHANETDMKYIKQFAIIIVISFVFDLGVRPNREITDTLPRRVPRRYKSLFLHSEVQEKQK